MRKSSSYDVGTRFNRAHLHIEHAPPPPTRRAAVDADIDAVDPQGYNNPPPPPARLSRPPSVDERIVRVFIAGVGVHVCVCACACVRARVRVRVQVRVRVRVRVHVRGRCLCVSRNLVCRNIHASKEYITLLMPKQFQLVLLTFVMG